jgi:magnesium-transporting ATPase (P-type)
MDDHKIELEELYERLKTCSDGLSNEVATSRNLELGDNCLPAPKVTPGWILFMHEILNWFAIMLWVGSGLCVMSYFIEPAQGLSNIYLAAVLICVIILTGSITYM